MDLSIKAQEIVTQATQWNFQGDCSLLQWMKEIAEHLEQKTNSTCAALQQLNADVNRTAIALDNSTNSLAALQNTQFVESRCREDDGEITNNAEKQAIETTKPAAADVLKSFLQNNIKVLHNCHEKYALEFEDSDEEEAENSCIYQPKNPYNERLLPHIYASKLWKEHWHVGLCEDINHYSGDEVSDTFSISSASPQPCEANDSNSSLLSEWNSSTSIPTNSNNLAVKSAASFQGSEKSLFSATVLPEKVEKDLNDFIENMPRPPIPVAATQTQPEPAKNAEESTANAAHFEEKRNQQLISQIAVKVKSRVEAPVPAVRKNIAEKPIESATPKTISSNTNNTQPRRPLNLFDSPPGSPVQEKPKSALPAAVPNTEIPDPEPAQRPKFTASNLFDDDLENDDDFLNMFAGAKEADKPKSKEKISLFEDEDDLFAAGSKSTKNDNRNLVAQKNMFFDTEPPPLPQLARQEETKKIDIKKPRLNLFDNDSDDAEDDLFSTKNLQIIKEQTQKNVENKKTESQVRNTLQTVTKERKTLKGNLSTLSLFPEDDDEDLDQMLENKFAKEEVTQKSKILEKKLPTLNLFSEEDDEDLDKILENKSAPVKENKESTRFERNIPSLNLFSDKNDEDLDKIFPKKSTAKAATKESTRLEKSKPSLNLFPEDNDDDLDNIFRSKSAAKEENKITTRLEKSLPPMSLFPEEDDENIDQIFAKNSVAERASKESTRLEKNIPNLNLFSEEDDEDLDKIFPNKTVAKAETKESKNAPPLGLFQEEDDADIENIFANKSATEQKTEESKTVQQNVPTLALFHQAEHKDIEKVVTNKSESEKETSPIDDNAVESTSRVSKSSIQSDELNAVKTEQTTNEIENMNNLKTSTEDAIFDDLNSENAETTDFTDAENDDIQNSNLTVIADNAKIHQYANIFSEEPPDDDDFFTVTNTKQIETSQRDFFEPPSMLSSTAAAAAATTTEASEIKTKTAKHIDYGAFGLFSDIPPDDDFLDKLANEEVQPDSCNEETEQIVSVEATSKGATASKDVTDKSSIIAADGRTISKLQMPQIKINVQALLPNAGGLNKMRKSIEQQQEQRQQRIENSDQTQQKPNEKLQQTEQKPTENSPESSAKDTNEHILSNVCKGRVRAPIKRRPSTRSARKENYRQSVVAATAEDKSYAEVDYTKSTSENTNANLKQNLLANLNSRAEDLQDDLFNVLNKNSKSENVSKKLESDFQQDLFSTLNKNLQSTQINTKIDKSFDDDLSEDLFGKIAIKTVPSSTETYAEAKKEKVKSAQTNKNVENSFDDDLSEDLFGKIAQKTVTITEAKKQSAQDLFTTTSATKTKLNSILLNNSDDDNDDDLFFNTSISPKKPTPTAVTKPLMVESKEISKSSLFDDEDDNDFDASLFGATSLQKPKVLTTIPQQQSATITQNKSKSLFFEQDDDDSDDDLFKSLKPTNKIAVKSSKPESKLAKSAAAVTKTIKAKSLFGSDDDDNEFSIDKSDNFFSAAKRTTAAKFNASTSSRLFDENIDDDEDLFSSTNTKFRTQAAKATTSVAKKINVKKQSSLTDNPLADLL